MAYENHVEGSKDNDNKQAGNKQKVSGGQTAVGKISGHQKPSYYAPQNSKPSTPAGPDQSGDEGVKTQAKRQKKIVRSGASYDDKAIKAAANARGMHATA